MPMATENVVELLADGIIYVERRGEQNESSLLAAFDQTSELAAQLRSQGRPVLILNHTHAEHVSGQVIAQLQHLDFDKVAVYGAPPRSNNIRDLMVRASALEDKIVSFQTKEEALAWLHSSLT